MSDVNAMMAYMMLVRGLEDSCEGETSRYSSRRMVDSIFFCCLGIFLFVTKVVNACGNGFCEMFVDERDCEAWPRAELAFLYLS